MHWLINVTHSLEEENPTGINMKAKVLDDSSLGELPFFEGIYTPLVLSLILDTPQLSSDTTVAVDLSTHYLSRALHHQLGLLSLHNYPLLRFLRLILSLWKTIVPLLSCWLTSPSLFK